MFGIEKNIYSPQLPSVLNVMVPEFSPFGPASLTVPWRIDENKLTGGRANSKKIQGLCSSGLGARTNEVSSAHYSIQ